MEPFATSGAVRDAFSDLGALTTELNDASKILSLRQITGKKANNRKEANDFLAFFARLLIYIRSARVNVSKMI